MPLATTGNLMRVVEAGYDFFVEKDSSSRRAFMVYADVIGAFAAGAISGAFTTRAWGLHAIWVPAGLLAVTLVLFVIDEREGRRRNSGQTGRSHLLADIIHLPFA
jgi:uncharacterized membrane protein YoaK (UPF0700 family)